jgi:hypothetical protein|nr:MAG TPA: head to tail connecting protein [Caudoviricetes sp.]
METVAQKLIKRFGVLKSEHSKWTGIWNDCARYCFPNAAPVSTFTDKTRGNPKRQPIDTTGVACLTKLAAWLYSSTIFQGEQWFDLKAHKKTHGDIEVEDTQLDRFLQKAARKGLEAIANSNCVQVYQQFLRGYCAFGTGAFYSEFNDDDELVCRQWNISDCVYIAENSKGMVDTVFRGFEYTARQAVQEFGYNNVSEDIRKAYDNPEEKEKRFVFIHAVFPRQERDKRKSNPKNKQWASIYIDEKAQKIVEEGGYDTFPYQVPRFYNTDEIYGRSPAMSAIPALRSINIAIWAYLKNVEGQSKPIVFAPSDKYDRMSLELGSINPWDSQDGDVKLWSPTGDLRSPLDFAAQKKEEVQGIFYNDVFQYLEDRKNMTATEAQLRYDEMIQGIAPVLANLHSEFFAPFIRRVILGLVERGKIVVPKLYRGKDGKMPDFEVVYNTRLDTKLKGVLNANVVNFIRMVGELAVAMANAPLAAAYIDTDKVVKAYARNNNVSNDALKSDDEIAEALQAMGQQQQQQQLLGMLDKVNLQKTPEEGSMQDTIVNGIR